MTRRPNPEQDAVVAASKDRGQNLSVAAGAGTGKTTTAVGIAEANPYTQVLYVAYNAATKEEAKLRFPRRNTRVVTSHGLAYGDLGKQFSDRLNSRASKQRSRAAAVNLGLQGEYRFAFCLQCQAAPTLGDEGHEGHPVVVERLEAWRLASLVKRTVERFCYSADRRVLARHCPKLQGIDERVMPLIRADAAVRAHEAWVTDLTSPDGKLWYWPDCYLKQYQLLDPRIRQRMIILDEAQDTNDCVWDIISKQSAQLVAVGDSNQMIYEWRGSKDVMELVANALRLQLTGSYRFGPAVAEEANLWLELLGSDLRLRGYRRLQSVVTSEPVAEDPDCLIYRTNAGCISGAISGLEGGHRVAIVGGGGAIQWLAEAAEDLLNGRPTDHPELVGFENWDEVKQFIKDEPEDAGSLVPLVKAVEEHGPQAIMDMTRKLVPEDRASLTVTTCHKAKGREWEHVRIGDDFPQPLPGRQPKREELRLAYVAVTRGKLLVERGSLDYAAAGA